MVISNEIPPFVRLLLLFIYNFNNIGNETPAVIKKEVVEQIPSQKANRDAVINPGGDTVLYVGHSTENTGSNEESIHLLDEIPCFTEAKSFSHSQLSMAESSGPVLPPSTSPFRKCLGRLKCPVI